MILDFKERFDLVRGARWAEFVNGAWQFRRMTPELTGVYSYSEPAVIRALTTTGVRLVFRAAPRRIFMEVEYGRACRQLFKMDVSVDGGEPQAFGPDAAAPGWAGVIFEDAAACEPDLVIISRERRIPCGLRQAVAK